MSHPSSESLGVVVELIRSYGPTFGPWVMAIFSIGVFAWIFGQFIKMYVRNVASSAQHMNDVVSTSEKLRSSMLAEKSRCEEECRRKDEIIAKLMEQRQQLIEEHSHARNIFLAEARELREAHQEAMEEVSSMAATVHVLTEELNAQRLQKRSTDP